MAEPKVETGKVLSQETITTVRDFYTNDEYSRMCAGKKECVTVKVNDMKEKLQKCLLLLNIRELYQELKTLNSNVKTGFSKFCELQPKQVVNVNSSGMHKVCVCKHNQNVKLLKMPLPSKFDYKDILKKVVCDINSRNCMLHVSQNCPGLDGVRNFITNYFNENNIDTDKEIIYMQCISTDRTTMNKLTSSVDEYITLIANEVFVLCEHHFIAKAQLDYLRTRKENLQQDEAIILLDFAENYLFVIQDVV